MALTWNNEEFEFGASYAVAQRFGVPVTQIALLAGKVVQVVQAGSTPTEGSPSWVTGHVYAPGDYVHTDSQDAEFICTIGGTSGPTEPSGNAKVISDGGVTWQYAGPGQAAWLPTGWLVFGTTAFIIIGDNEGAVTSGAPELATSSYTLVEKAAWMALAEKMVANAAVWGNTLAEGRIYYAAHLAQLAKLKGSGPITSKTAGPLSQSYAALGMKDDDAYNLTAAGRMYLSLLRATQAILGFVV